MGFVGFTYLIIFLVILYYVILLAILAGGFALFYWGLRSHRKPENEKKAWTITLKISGIAIMAFMLVAIVTNAVQIARKVNELVSPDHYELPESTNSIDTVQQMLKLADENDRDQFRSMFSESYRNSDLMIPLKNFSHIILRGFQSASFSKRPPTPTPVSLTEKRTISIYA